MKGQWSVLLFQPATAAGALAMGLAMTGALLVQQQRDGWPFAVDERTSATAQLSSPAAVATEHGNHPRAAIELDPAPLAMAGLRLEAVRRESLASTVRTVATVVPDERRIWHAHTRVAGWIEQLFVATVGEPVHAGQPLAAVFSQDLFASQLEYLAARAQAEAGPRSAAVESGRTRLAVLGMTEAEIAAIESSGQARRLVTVAAPHGGVVLRRAVSVGTAVDPSTELLTVADLSSVWVLAEVPEEDAAYIEAGMPAELIFPGIGPPPLQATVDFVYPTLSERTRSVRVRFVIANPSGVLRPGMYGTALFRGTPREVLTIPRDALVDTGLLQHVFVAAGDGRFEPRVVTPGLRMADRVEIADGLIEGELVVSAGVFLLDSESRLRGGAGVGHAGHGAVEDKRPAVAHEIH